MSLLPTVPEGEVKVDILTNLQGKYSVVSYKFFDERGALNTGMLNRQGCSKQEIQEIVHHHCAIYLAKKAMKELNPEKDRPDLRMYASGIEQIEYQLQGLWRFPQKKSHHIQWFRLPHCKCPNMDNADMWGVDERIINCDCPIHGKGVLLDDAKTLEP